MSVPRDAGQQLLDLLSDPFATTFSSNSIYFALYYNLGGAVLFFLLFSLLRPRNPSVYAPRGKHADTKHAPPQLKKGFFSWRGALQNVKEEVLVESVGLDAVIFLRFLRTCRNIFLVLTIFGCGILIPVNLAPGSNIYQAYGNVAILMRFTPQYIFGSRFWAYVACAYVFDAVICGILYYNYVAVARLRQRYFQSETYQNSLHSRTLMITHISKPLRNDQGINEIMSEAKTGDENPSVSIGRDITGLAELIDQHDDAVVELEKRLAIYLGNPNRLPAKRPTMKPFKGDKEHPRSDRVDAINYLYSYIQRKKAQIGQAREEISNGKQSAMSYGFASFSEIETAHSAACAAGNKQVLKASIRLAPEPRNVLWKSLPMTRPQKRNRRIWFGFLMFALTVLYIVPNVFAAVFLSNLGHLGIFWHDFRVNLDRHPDVWAAVQGIAAPLLQNLFYFFLPTVFRRWYNHSGDNTKTQRERHVANRLFVFFVFNRVFVFSLFASIFGFISAVVQAQQEDGAWNAIKRANIFSSLVFGLCRVSPYWLTLQMQHNLLATYDLLQIVRLVWNPLMRRVMSPTPRQIIKFDQPAPMMYAEYYSTYLFIVMVGMCFATIQPLILPVTAVYLVLEYWFKKYLLQYVYVTKLESGGLFWKNLFNRILVCALFGNIIVALIVGSSTTLSKDYTMLYAMIPLPIFLAGFKWYCAAQFNNKIQYYTGENPDVELRTHGNFLSSKSARDPSSKPSSKSSKTKLSVRFGHPALYKRLMTIMVNDKSKYLLSQVIQDHASHDMDGNNDTDINMGVNGYTDVFMSRMAGPTQPGKLAPNAANTNDAFELVAEEDMEFSKFKKREDFRDDAGGGGELYGIPDDLISRSGTPGIESSDYPSRSGTPSSFRSRTQSPSPSRGTVYPAGYHQASLRNASPASRTLHATPPRIHIQMPSEDYDLGDPSDEARGRLLRYGAPMGERDQSIGIAATPGTGLPTPASMDDDGDTSYEYFRQGGRHGRG